MNWYKLFYLMTMADRLQDFFDAISNITTCLTALVFVIFIIAFIASKDATNDSSAQVSANDWKKYSLRMLYLFAPIAVITWFLYIATPSKKDALLIVAGGAVGTFITSDSSAQRLPADITNFLRAKIVAETKEIGLESILPNQDTLKEKSKEELIEMIKNQSK